MEMRCGHHEGATAKEESTGRVGVHLFRLLCQSGHCNDGPPLVEIESSRQKAVGKKQWAHHPIEVADRCKLSSPSSIESSDSSLRLESNCIPSRCSSCKNLTALMPYCLRRR